MNESGVIAVGWATVDVEHPAAGWHASADDTSGLTAARSGLDEALGARAVAVPSPAGLVLLEPATEGRVAASLARRGEGPAAIYLRTSRTPAELRAAGLVLSATAAGPFGSQALVVAAAAGSVGAAGGVGSRFGPHVVVVLEPRPTDTIAP